MYLHWLFFAQSQPSVQVSRIMLLYSYKKEECGRDPEKHKLEDFQCICIKGGATERKELNFKDVNCNDCGKSLYH